MTRMTSKILASIALMFAIAVPNPAKASVTSFQKENDGVLFKLDKGTMKVNICLDNMVEVRYTIFKTLPVKKSLVVVNPWETHPQFKVSETKNEIVISTRNLVVHVDKATNGIQFFNLQGDLILSEDGANGTTMNPATIDGIATYNCSTEFNSPSNEALYGLGCHPTDTLSIDYKGRNQSLAIMYLTGAIPVLLSNKGYGLMWDNYSASDFYGKLDHNTKYKYVSESGKMVDYYFMYGPSLDKVVASYRIATGEAPMFPKWAFGLFQSQDRYKSQAEVLSVKDNYRNNHIPVDCIVQDWYYWEPEPIGSNVMYAERYPNPKEMVNELHKAHIHAMISIWPVFGKGSANYKAMLDAGNLTTLDWKNVVTNHWDYYYDVYSKKARTMYWNKANSQLISRDGWDAWWVDQCEPDVGNDRIALRKTCNFAIGKGIDYFNTYSLMHTTGLYTNWRKDIPGKRAFFLVRQAFAGQQRNATTLWSSDVTCTWRAFKSQVPQGINACASGIPYWTSDIGGYHLNWAAPDWSTPANRELFTRWFQFGTFCPIFRIHGKGERALYSDNWDAKTKAILLNYDNLRYRLMPYIYSLGWKVTHQGYTIMRALAFDFKNDAAIDSIPDEYMFGPAFLVNPVTYSMMGQENGTKMEDTRKVYLPKETIWYDFWTGEKYQGGQTIDAKAPIETLPLFMKAGSIVPMGPFLQYATEKPANPLEIRIYPGADGSFVLYEDENNTYDYEKGVYATISFKWNDARHELIIGKRQGSFPGMLQNRTFHIIIVTPAKGTGVAITKDPDKTVQYNGAEQTIKL
ncbi:glycoside hydrolase family 31 protein [Microbacter margulisiae]|uniref:Alpha-D-xyloside xylohydrolase n=1 Tax=Microbacter margulisiae TaxID=1350067 RepID=A0A7W5DTM0_9PORP|nr:glycoside hydrolase family 31 protein [Microbacter margulisiae]MBB3188498.1 alpha-D-xyloside xylohydrolase [Microbacter margulisiae]